ncbi:MAG: copper oxidase [Nitrospirota bacterium]
MKRREFLKKSALTLGAVVFSGKEVMAQMMHEGHKIPGMVHEGMDMKRKEMFIHKPLGWADPNIKISPPPSLTGKQMGKVHTPNVPPLGYEMDGKVKVFRLIVQPVERNIHDGIPPEDSLWYKFHKAKGMQPDMFPAMFLPKKIKGWGFNGSIPGPTIEVYEGDRVRIIVKNEIPEPTSIHWHGIELPNGMDGVGGLTQPPIMPGENFIYEFTLYQNGTFFYHSAFNEMKQVGMGLGGAFVIHPKKEKSKIDKDFVIVMNEWKLLPGNENPDVTSTDPDWFTFNGKAAPSTEVLNVNQGDRVRIRLINFSNQNDHPIHIHGHTWWVKGTEAGPIPKSAQWPGNTVDVMAGSSRDVEFIAWNPGYWQLHCHKLHHIMNAEVDMPMGVMPMGGLATILNVIPKDRSAKWRHPKEGGGL